MSYTSVYPIYPRNKHLLAEADEISKTLENLKIKLSQVKSQIVLQQLETKPTQIHTPIQQEIRSKTPVVQTDHRIVPSYGPNDPPNDPPISEINFSQPKVETKTNFTVLNQSHSDSESLLSSTISNLSEQQTNDPILETEPKFQKKDSVTSIQTSSPNLPNKEMNIEDILSPVSNQSGKSEHDDFASPTLPTVTPLDYYTQNNTLSNTKTSKFSSSKTDEIDVLLESKNKNLKHFFEKKEKYEDNLSNISSSSKFSSQTSSITISDWDIKKEEKVEINEKPASAYTNNTSSISISNWSEKTRPKLVLPEKKETGLKVGSTLNKLDTLSDFSVKNVKSSPTASSVSILSWLSPTKNKSPVKNDFDFILNDNPTSNQTKEKDTIDIVVKTSSDSDTDSIMNLINNINPKTQPTKTPTVKFTETPKIKEFEISESEYEGDNHFNTNLASDVDYTSTDSEFAPVPKK